MSRVRMIKGDLFGTTLPMIVHSVNCRGKFASGVAAQVARKFPNVREAYLAKFEREGWHLGEVQVVATDSGKVVANVAGQDEFGYDGKPYANYEAIRDGAEVAARICTERGFAGFACPKLGCGLGGLEWSHILSDLEIISEGYDVDVHIYYL